MPRARGRRGHLGDDEARRIMNRLGADGWDLVTVVGDYAVFKRPTTMARILKGENGNG